MKSSCMRVWRPPPCASSAGWIRGAQGAKRTTVAVMDFDYGTVNTGGASTTSAGMADQVVDEQSSTAPSA
jgi:hypothetical protein